MQITKETGKRFGLTADTFMDPEAQIATAAGSCDRTSMRLRGHS